MIKTSLCDDNQSEKYICKEEVSTLLIKRGYSASKSIIVKMKNSESFEIYYNEKILKELTE